MTHAPYPSVDLGTVSRCMSQEDFNKCRMSIPDPDDHCWSWQHYLFKGLQTEFLDTQTAVMGLAPGNCGTIDVIRDQLLMKMPGAATVLNVLAEVVPLRSQHVFDLGHAESALASAKLRYIIAGDVALALRWRLSLRLSAISWALHSEARRAESRTDNEPTSSTPVAKWRVQYIPYLNDVATELWDRNPLVHLLSVRPRYALSDDGTIKRIPVSLGVTENEETDNVELKHVRRVAEESEMYQVNVLLSKMCVKRELFIAALDTHVSIVSALSKKKKKCPKHLVEDMGYCIHMWMTDCIGDAGRRASQIRRQALVNHTDYLMSFIERMNAMFKTIDEIEEASCGSVSKKTLLTAPLCEDDNPFEDPTDERHSILPLMLVKILQMDYEFRDLNTRVPNPWVRAVAKHLVEKLLDSEALTTLGHGISLLMSKLQPPCPSSEPVDLNDSDSQPEEAELDVDDHDAGWLWRLVDRGYESFRSSVNSNMYNFAIAMGNHTLTETKRKLYEGSSDEPGPTTLLNNNVLSHIATFIEGCSADEMDRFMAWVAHSDATRR